MGESSSEVVAANPRLDPASQLPPLRPPPGHMIDPPAQWFTREGGTLYSPIHGIEVVIPPEAPPLGVDKFWLSIHVYPRGPFVLPEGVVSCSPAVWFFLSPTFEFVHLGPNRPGNEATCKHAVLQQRYSRLQCQVPVAHTYIISTLDIHHLPV